MTGPFTIEVRLTGGDVHPATVGARDAAVLIAAVETMIASMLPDDGRADEVLVSLAGLAADGFALMFASPQPEIVEAAFARVIESFQGGSLDMLPPRTVEALRGALRITRKHGASLELSAPQSRRGAPLRRAAFPPDLTVYAPEEATLRAACTLYGAVIRVGGEESPRARLRLINGQVITCDLARRRGWALARDLGGRLYQVVGVRGEARVRISDHALVGYRIDRLLPYVPIGIDRALDSLAEAAPVAFSSAAAVPADLREDDL